MFTGLIQAVGTVNLVEKTEAGARFKIASSFASDLEMGESIAVNGVCLTVVEIYASGFVADVIPATLECTIFSGLRESDRVNLERALQVGDRLGGHFVQGHVDGVATVVSLGDDDLGRRLRLTLPSSLLKYVAQKGSITLNGVSLTVSDVVGFECEVALIPHTLENTNLGDLKEGDKINVEVDLLARYLEGLTSKNLPM